MTTDAPSSFTDTIQVTATRISEADVSVGIIADGYEFLRITIAKEPVEEWISKGILGAEMMQVYANANPANEVIRQLLPLLPKLVSLDPETDAKFQEFKREFRELVGKHSVLPA